MNDQRVRELSDGEEMVVERETVRGFSDDPRDQTIEARRLAFDQASASEGRRL